MKNRIIDIIFPRLEGSERAWHRLIKVLIILSTITIIIGGIFYLIDDNYFYTSYKTIYSFEEGYLKIDETEQRCNFHTDHDKRTTFLFCKLGNTNRIPSISFDETSSFIKRFLGEEKNYGEESYKILYEMIYVEGTISPEKDIYKKGHRTFDYLSFIFILLVILVVLPSLWFIFWNSIVYRIILYIIYGSNRNS